MTLTTHQSSATVAIKPAPLSNLPIEVAEKLKDLAWAAAWHTANTRAGYRDAETDLLNYKQASHDLDTTAKGLNLSPNTLELIKTFAMDAAWHCANTRKGYKKAAANDLNRANLGYTRLYQSGEITQPLAANLTQLFWAASWYCANTRAKYNDDAKADEARFNHYFHQVCGPVKFISLDFLTSGLEILQTKPVAVVNQTLTNYSDREQEMSAKVSIMKGYTKEWSHNVGFRMSSTVKVQASVEVAEVSRDFTIEASYGYTQGGSETTQQTKEFEYPVKVGQMQQVTVKGTVHEAEMTVPYRLVYKIGEVERRIEGVWHGVACSEATMTVSNPAPLSK